MMHIGNAMISLDKKLLVLVCTNLTPLACAALAAKFLGTKIHSAISPISLFCPVVRTFSGGDRSLLAL